MDLGLTKPWMKEYVGILHEIIVRILKNILKCENHWGRISVVYNETCSSWSKLTEKHQWRSYQYPLENFLSFRQLEVEKIMKVIFSKLFHYL